MLCCIRGKISGHTHHVNLIKKVKIEGSWRFAPVVYEANGRLKDKVCVSGRVEVHSEGTYYIEWREHGRRYRTSVTREDALCKARRKSVELHAIREGLIIAPRSAPKTSPRTPVGEAIDEYLHFVRLHHKLSTYLSYRFTLDSLLRSAYQKKYVEDAARQDVLNFMTFCYKRGLGKRTVYHKVVTVLQLFKRHGCVGLMQKGDWPKYVDIIRPVYEPEELQAMFDVATEEEADLLKFILGTGFRDQENRYVEYLNIDFRHHLVRVTAKPGRGFTPKNWTERTVPLPVGLIERLCKRKERKKARPQDLIFGNSKGRHDEIPYLRTSSSVDARTVRCKGRNRPCDDGIQPKAHYKRAGRNQTDGSAATRLIERDAVRVLPKFADRCREQ